MAGKGYDLEAFFRQAFSVDESVDFLSLMDAAMTVAAFKYPEEFAKRTSGINKTLAITKTRKEESKDPKKIDSDHQPKSHHRHIIRIPAKKRTTSIGRDKNTTPVIHKSEDLKKLEPEKINATILKPKDLMKQETKQHAAEEERLSWKLSGTKRKLRERYEQMEKSKRRSQVLDVKDLPKIPCERGPIRRRLVR